jgi:hypothetical protein
LFVNPRPVVVLGCSGLTRGLAITTGVDERQGGKGAPSAPPFFRADIAGPRAEGLGIEQVVDHLGHSRRDKASHSFQIARRAGEEAVAVRGIPFWVVPARHPAERRRDEFFGCANATRRCRCDVSATLRKKQ